MASGYIPKSRFSEGIGYLGLVQIIASAVGPGLGTKIMNLYGVRYSFYIAAGFSMLALLVISLFRYQMPQKEEKRGITSLRSMIAVEVVHYSFISGCYSFINGVVASFLILFAAQRGLADVSIYFTINAISLFLARPISGKIVDRFGLKYVVYAAVVMTVSALLLLISMNAMWMLLLSAAIRGLAQGALQPSMQAACIQKVGVQKSGTATGTYYLGADIGQGLGPILGGFIAGLWGYQEIFYFCIGLIILTGVVYWITEDRRKA